MVSIQFAYKGIFYYALMRLKDIDLGKEYYITIMNGELEKILYKNHIFACKKEDAVTNPVTVGPSGFTLSYGD